MLHHRVANENHEPGAWEWIIDVLAEELARVPGPDRRTLIDTLVARAGYPAFDFGDDPQIRIHNARVRLALGMAKRAAEA